MPPRSSTKPAEPSAEERALTTLDQSLAAYHDDFARVLAGRVDPEVFVSVAYEAARTNADLLEVVLQNPGSLMKALHDAAALALVPNGVLGSAYIVPRKNGQTGKREAYFQPGFRGLVELTLRSGKVRHVESHNVFERDTFALTYGDKPGVTHEPFLDGERGKQRGTYAIAFMSDGSTVVEYMSLDEIEKIHARSAAKNAGPWKTDFLEMCRKTVVRRLCKSLPMSVEVQRAIELDDRAEVDEARVTAEKPKGPTADSLAGRIRQLQGTGTVEHVEEKNVTPTEEPAEQAEPKRERAPKVEASDEPPDDEEPASEPEEAQNTSNERTYEAADAPANLLNWHGTIVPGEKGAKLDTGQWKAKLEGGDDTLTKLFDSLDGDHDADVSGRLELVPWERDGRSMPPYRKITAYVVTIR